MAKLLIVGQGGIGSVLSGHLHALEEIEQINDLHVTVCDDDLVELKNIKYQNFGPEDVTDFKVESISARYGFKALNKKITSEEDLKGYDCIVSAVDNVKFRKLLFEFVDKNPKIYWIDLRSEGRSVAAFTKSKKNTLEKMLETLPKDGDDSEGGSCQLKFELENNIIQQGNKIIAVIGSQMILNWLRKETNMPEFIQNI